MNLAICFKSPPWNVQHMTGIDNFSYGFLSSSKFVCLFFSFFKALHHSYTRHLGAFLAPKATSPSGTNAETCNSTSSNFFSVLMRITLRWKMSCEGNERKSWNCWWEEMWRWPQRGEFKVDRVCCDFILFSWLKLNLILSWVKKWENTFIFLALSFRWQFPRWQEESCWWWRRCLFSRNWEMTNSLLTIIKETRWIRNVCSN